MTGDVVTRAVPPLENPPGMQPRESGLGLALALAPGMATLEEGTCSLTAAIEHAARSLALAREILSTDDPPRVPHAREEAKARVRTEITHVTRLLENTSEPTETSFAALNRAARQLDDEAANLDRALHP